ncbi:MAG: hypothetical protein H6779_03150 [Candidatus Nomurabacteria bacterium]|nr:MAG: hypothetical protein H6779_03150 [Candidatus Nomurabacteria bacterium]
MMNKLSVHKIDGFRVVRGDLVPGGIKHLALEEALRHISEIKIACAVHEYGHSGLALAIAAMKMGKEAHIFLAGNPRYTYVTEYLKDFPNVFFHFANKVRKQHEVGNLVKNWARENEAFHLPIGFNCELFRTELIKLAKETITSPEEVWVAVGSGTTFGCLKEAWPKTKVCGVSLGFLLHDVEYTVIEKSEEVAREYPPYPSAPFYDAKIWRFVKEKARRGAVIWNIA